MAATGPVHADGLKDAAMMLSTVSSHRSGLGKNLCFVVLIWCAGLSSAYGLEKYGRPLPSMEKQGEEAREAEETLFGGYLLAAPFVSNPTFAARPDNTGLVGMRYMAHLEVDLYNSLVALADKAERPVAAEIRLAVRAHVDAQAA